MSTDNISTISMKKFLNSCCLTELQFQHYRMGGKRYSGPNKCNSMVIYRVIKKIIINFWRGNQITSEVWEHFKKYSAKTMARV